MVQTNLDKAVSVVRRILYGLVAIYAFVIIYFFGARGLVLLRAVWMHYLAVLKSRPLTTKCFTSMTGFFLGDTIAQHLSQQPPRSPRHFHDWPRTARFMSFGFFLHAPSCHWFFEQLDRLVLPNAPRSWPAILWKVAADRCILTPVLMAACFSYIRAMEGNWREIRPTLSEKLLKTWVVSQAVWPLAHIVNFSVVPPEQRVLFVNVVSVFWNVVLCQMASSTPKLPRLPRAPSRRLSRAYPLSSIKQEA
eukprot:jgi/Botrbrau1/12026/Bobra.0293s0003.1